MRTRSLTLALLALMTFSARPHAQWSSIQLAPGDQVKYSGGMMLRVGASGISAFSALAQEWTPLAPAGSTSLYVGQWIALVREPNGDLRGYSALRNESSLLANSAAVTLANAGSELVVALEPPGGSTRVWVYDAPANAWASQLVPGGVIKDHVATAGSCACVKSFKRYDAYSSRTHAWATFTTQQATSAEPVVEPTYVAANLFGPQSLDRRVACFSAVHGAWSVSPVYATGSIIRYAAQTCAFDVVAAGGGYRPCAYSPFTHAWTEGPLVHAAHPWIRCLGTWALASNEGGATNVFQGFATATGTWSALDASAAPASSFTTQGFDYCLVRSTGNRLHAFSGLTGNWASIATDELAAPDAAQWPLRLLVCKSTALAYAYSPGIGAWSAPVPTSGVAASGSSVYLLGGVLARAFSTRSGQWTDNPQPHAGTSGKAGGTFCATYTSIGVEPAALHVFDERSSTWLAPQPVAPGPFGEHILLAGTAQGASSPPRAFSSLSGRWSQPVGAAPLASVVTPEEFVAGFVDASDRLWAFGACDESHVGYDWPDGPWFNHAGALATGASAPFALYAVRGKANVELALTYASTALATPPLVVPGIAGALGLDPATSFLVGAATPIGTGGVAVQELAVPSPLPAAVQFALQSVLIDPVSASARFAGRAQPAWFF